MSKARKIVERLLGEDQAAMVGDGGGKRCQKCGGRTVKREGKRQCVRCQRSY